MKYLGFIIQFLCILSLLSGEIVKEYDLFRYTICFLAFVNLIYLLFKEFTKE